MRTIPLEVNEATAEMIAQLSASEKAELARLIKRWMQDQRTLRTVMDDISVYAQRQGLTPEMLDQLLKDE